MPLTLEVSYFNSYYVKRLADVPYIPSVAITRTASSTQANVPAGNVVNFNASVGFDIAVGMYITGAGITIPTKVNTVTSQTQNKI